MADAHPGFCEWMMKVSPRTSVRGVISRGLVLIMVAVLALTTVGVAVRTQAVLGRPVAMTLGRWALRHHLDLRVRRLEPLGLTGVRLRDVDVRGARGRLAFVVHLPHVDITPDLVGSILAFRPKIARIAVDSGRVEVRLLRALPRVPALAAGKPAHKSAQSAGHPPTHPSKHENSWRLSAPQTLVIRHVTIAGAGASIRLTHSILLHRLVAHWAPDSSWARPSFFHANGTLPDGKPYTLTRQASSSPERAAAQKRAEKPATPAITYALSSLHRLRFDQWMSPRPPLDISARNLVILPSRKAPGLIANDVRVNRIKSGSGEDLPRLRAPSARVWTNGSTVHLESDHATILMSASGRAGLALGHTEVVARHGRAGGRANLRLKTTLRDAHGGSARLDARWNKARRVLDVSGRFRALHVADIVRRLGRFSPVDAGTLDGVATARWNGQQALLSLHTNVNLRKVTARIGFLSPDALVMPRLGLRGDVLVDLAGKNISVGGGQAALGNAGTIRFSGQLINAVNGWSFIADVGAKKLDAAKLPRALPPAMTDVVKGAKLQGNFGFDVQTSGQTTSPDDLVLNVKFTGDVKATRDSPDADVAAMAARIGTSGPPAKLPLIKARHVLWVNYHALPPVVPRVVLAAEDANFFVHPALDFKGLRLALANDLKDGHFDRGGSTITQQVVKNLFLSHRRTLVRKIQEAYLSWRLEQELTKQRILELYLNIAQWGHGVFGIARAAHHYFGVHASQLTVADTALLAAILPGPEIYGHAIDAGFLPSSRLTKITHILKNLRFLKELTFPQSHHLYEMALHGHIGRLRLKLCADDDTAPAGTAPCEPEQMMITRATAHSRDAGAPGDH